VFERNILGNVCTKSISVLAFPFFRLVLVHDNAHGQERFCAIFSAVVESTGLTVPSTAFEVEIIQSF
jgi:hypothetical protein